jgi:hypothetical protein
MKPTNEIKAVDFVRKIRDAHARELAGKSPAEIMAFFNRAGDRAKRELRRGNRVATPTKRIAGR